MSAHRFALASTFVLIAGTAFAHHPGVQLNEVMAAQEPGFEPLDHIDAPEFDLTTATGAHLHLADFDGKVLILSFVAGDCGPDCVAQQAALAAVQARVNITPMLGMADFLTILEPGHSLPEAATSAFDPANWQVLTADLAAGDPAAGDPAAYAAVSTRKGALPMTFMVDRLGQVGGIFHGTTFGQVNMVLYINGLTNDHSRREPTLWQWLGSWF